MELLESPKLSFSIFPVLKGLNRTKKTIKIIWNLQGNHFSSNSNRSWTFFWFFIEHLAISLPGKRCAGPNTDLPSNSNISKTVRVNIAFRETFLIEYLISFLMICKLVVYALVVLHLLMFKVCGIIGISQIKFFNFSSPDRVKAREM